MFGGKTLDFADFTENSSSLNDSIIEALLKCNVYYFAHHKRKLEEQLRYMPKIEKLMFKNELMASTDYKSKIMEMGVNLLDRNFIH